VENAENDEPRKETPSPAYRQKMRQLLVNLKKPFLRQRVVDGQISAKKLVGLGSMVRFSLLSSFFPFSFSLCPH
jgi:hypothetical protein